MKWNQPCTVGKNIIATIKRRNNFCYPLKGNFFQYCSPFSYRRSNFAIEKSPILLSQYWINEWLDVTIIILYFVNSNNIFADCIFVHIKCRFYYSMLVYFNHNWKYHGADCRGKGEKSFIWLEKYMLLWLYDW